MKPVANLVIEMAANVARLEKDMSRARSSVDGAMQKIRKSAQLAMRALGALGLGLGAAQMAGFVKQAINAGDRMQKLSQQIGIATENIAGLEMAFRQGGASSTELEMAMARLSLGINNQTAAYRDLGIQSQDTLGALMEIADIVQQMPDGLQKSAMANELFGRSGAKIIPILNQGSAGLRRYIELSQRLGTSVTPEVAKQFELYNDTMDDVSEAMSGLAMQAAVALIPTLQNLAQALRDAFADGTVQRGVETLIEALKLLGIAIAGKLIASIASMTAGLIGLAASLTTGTAAVGAFSVAVTGLKGVMALLGGPVGLIATVAGALIYFSEQANRAETSLEGMTEKLGLANGELERLTKTQAEAKILDITTRIGELEAQAISAAAELENMNNQMLDPEAYLIGSADSSRKLNTLNKQIDNYKTLIEKLRGQINKTAKSQDVLLDAVTVTATAGKSAANVIQELIDKYREETAQLIMSNDEKERSAFTQALLNEGIREGTKAYKEYLDLFDQARLERRTIESQLEYIERQEQIDKERLEKRIAQEEEFAREAQRINDQIGQSLTDALMDGGRSAKEYLIDLFRTLVLRPILQPVISGVLGMMGVGSAGAALAGGMPGGEMLGGGNDVFGLVSALKSGYDVLSGGFTAVGTAAAEFAASMQYGTSMFSQQTAMLAAQEAGMATTVGTIGAAATVLAGVAAGVAAGSFISGQYSVFGDPMVATALGTAAGTAIGFAVGGPIGAAIGAFVGGTGGGLINRAFGRGPKETQASGITGTLSAGDSNLMAFQDWSRAGGWFSSGSSGTDLKALDSQIVGYLNQETAAIGLSVRILAEQLGQSSDRIGQYSEQIRLDLLNLSDEEAQEKITEALSRFSDNLVNFIVPSIQFMTKEGETSSEALSRLSTSLAAVNSSFAVMGIQTQELSLNSAQAASNLIDLVGGIDAFTQKTDFIYQNFYTQQERVAQLTNQVSSVFEQLGFVMPTTRDGFKELYEVVAGSGSASLTAALLEIAPAMNEVIGYTEQLTEAQRQQSDAIANERLGLERQLMQALGNTIALREMELDALDASNRALQAQLFALEDSQTALDEASEATDLAFSKLEQSLQNELVNTLNDLETAFNALTGSLNDQISAARVASEVANENLRDLQSVFLTLDREINSLLRGTTQSTAQGFAFINQALQTARATGYLPDESSLSEAITAARGGLGSEQFSTGFDQRRATAVLANQLIELRDITGDQVTVQERQISIAEAQLVVLTQRLEQAQRQYDADQESAQSDFDRQLEEAQNQINVLRNIDDSIFSVEQAVNLLKSSIDNERTLMVNLQKQMISLQQEANARAAAEAARLQAEREAEAARQAAEAKAIADAQRRSEERAAAEAAAAEAARIARARAAAEAAARAEAERAAAAAAEQARAQSVVSALSGGAFRLNNDGTISVSSGFGYGPDSGMGGSSPNYDQFGEGGGFGPEETFSDFAAATGGYRPAGLGLVGEEGPELVNFARPSMIYTAGETAEIMNGGKSQETNSEIRQLRTENQAQSRALVSLQARMTRLLERWDGDGLPTERYEETTA